MQTLSYWAKYLTSLPVVTLSLTGCFGEPEYLDQNWTEENDFRVQSYHTSQGSQLIPYDWYINLQAANGLHPLHDNATYEALRYLPDYTPDPAVNPDGLPIGFVKDSDPNTGDWIGINCAACHTGQLIFDTTLLRIDGAPSMGDYRGLLQTVRDAIGATLASPSRFNHFARRLNIKTQSAKSQLRDELEATVSELDQSITNASSPDHIPGYGRIDAFAAIKNEVFVTDLGIEANYQQPNAPVSYPFLWDTPHLDRVQWTGHVENPYARNVGQVLGVLGRLNLQDPSEFFNSSVRRDSVFLLEEWMAELQSPKWPEAVLGDIDPIAAAQGKTLYKTPDASGYACVDCHSLPDDDTGQYPLTPASHNAFGMQFIQTYNTPIAEVGTDPNTLANVYSPTPLQTGPLSAALGGQTEIVGGVFLSMVTGATVGNLFAQAPALTQEQQVAFSRFRIAGPGHPGAPTIGYKARPLNGIWATGPFLHNGSVPSLWALLQPPEQRPTQFWVGNMLYDNTKVGYRTDWVPGAFKLNTQVPGNLAVGHAYGTALDVDDKWALIEFLKTL